MGFHSIMSNMVLVTQMVVLSNSALYKGIGGNFRHSQGLYTVKPKFIQTPSTFLTLSQFIRYSLENGNKI